MSTHFQAHVLKKNTPASNGRFVVVVVVVVIVIVVVVVVVVVIVVVVVVRRCSFVDVRSLFDVRGMPCHHFGLDVAL